MTTSKNSEKRAFYQSLTFTSRAQILREIGIRYLADPFSSAKMMHTAKAKGVLEYLLYLKPVEVDGICMCPKCEHCKANCLVGAGRARIFKGAKGEESHILRAKRIRSELYLYNRKVFMQLLVSEMNSAMNRAKKLGLGFMARMNGTSDLSLKAFRLEGKPIYEIFPDVQFCEYTKVFKYIEQTLNVLNVDYTFSFDGYNWDDCKKALDLGRRVAVVFKGKLPKMFNGYKVVNGDISDVRCDDGKNVIVGLKYKQTSNKDISTEFIVKEDDPRRNH